MKYLIAPNGKRITGTYEMMPCSYMITDVDKHEDGSVSFDYTGDHKDFYEDCDQVVRDGQRIFVDEDGDEWPENLLELKEDGQ